MSGLLRWERRGREQRACQRGSAWNRCGPCVPGLAGLRVWQCDLRIRHEGRLVIRPPCHRASSEVAWALILDSRAPAAPLNENPSIYLAAYAAWARERFQHLLMIGLGRGDLELVLDEVYVPLAFALQDLDRWGAGKEQAHREAPESAP
jgi:hypothetical protein